jgi:hypothetical protein
MNRLGPLVLGALLGLALAAMIVVSGGLDGPERPSAVPTPVTGVQAGIKAPPRMSLPAPSSMPAPPTGTTTAPLVPMPTIPYGD